MKCQGEYYIIVLVFMFNISCEYGKDCEALTIKVYVDDAITSDRQIEQVYQLINSVTRAVPDRSSLDLNLVGSKIENVASISVPSQDYSWRDQLKEALGKPRSGEDHVISFRKVIDNDFLPFFGVNQYKSKAELVIIVALSSTKFDARHSIIWKKKTFVVILGNRASIDQNNVASREDHVFIIPEPEGLENVTGSLSKTICKDSEFHCDTDRYSLRKGSKCKNCSENACSDTQAPVDISNTCRTRCPFYKTPTEETKVEPEVNYESVVKIEDHKPTASAAILTAVFITMVLIGVISLVTVIKHRGRRGERTGHGEDIPLQNGPDETRNSINLPVSIALQETCVPLATQQIQEQNDDEGGAASGVQHVGGLTDEEIAAASVKNERERIMNGTALVSPVHNIHASVNLHQLSRD